MKSKTIYVVVLVSLLFGVLLSYLYVNRSMRTADFSTDMEIVELNLDKETAQKVYENFEKGDYEEAMKNFSEMLVDDENIFLHPNDYAYISEGIQAQLKTFMSELSKKDEGIYKILIFSEADSYPNSYIIKNIPICFLED